MPRLLLVTDDEEEKFDERFVDIRKPYGVFIVGAQYGLIEMLAA